MTKPLTALEHLAANFDILKDPDQQFGADIWRPTSTAPDLSDTDDIQSTSLNFSSPVTHDWLARNVDLIGSVSGLDAISDPGIKLHTSSLASHVSAINSIEPGSFGPDGGGTSPTLAQEIAFECGVTSTGTLAATSFWTWNGNTPAGYESTSNAHKWGSSNFETAGGTIDYYFTPSSDWTATEKSVFEACLTLWSDIANINFAQTTIAADAQITITRGASGSGAFDNTGWSGSGSVGTIGGSTLWTITNSMISIDTTADGFGPITSSFSTDGGYPWMTILHELGHAIGLGHTGPYNDGNPGSSDPDSAQYSAYDTRLWGIMSYIMPSDTATYSSQYPVTGTSWGTTTTNNLIYDDVPTTPMPVDIAAAQTLYGASKSSAYAGGQVFGFGCNITDATKQFYDFTVNTKPIVTIWDAGTGNTLNLSGFSGTSKINLNPGTFTSCDGMVNNIGIAFGTKIDTAYATTGNTTFVANTDADHLNGEAGNDTFDMMANFKATDVLNGGAGTNTVVLDGNYTSASAVTLGASTLTDIQDITLDAGFSYNLTLNAANIASSATLTIAATTLTSGETLAITASAQTTGTLIVKTGAGTSTVHFGGGTHEFTGGAGNDEVIYTNGFKAADEINGGGGVNTLVIDGNYTGSGEVVMGATTLTNFQEIFLDKGFSYDLVTNAATVTSGHTLEIDGLGMVSGNNLTFTGTSAVGKLLVYCGAGINHITGGDAGDTFYAESGTDTFNYTSAAQSTNTNYDTINGMNFSTDKFNLTPTITGINTAITSGTLSTSTFNTNLAAAVNASHLSADHAVLFTPNAGTLSGQTFLIVDLNGTAGYQAGADLVIHLSGQTGTLTTGDFI